MSARGYVVSDGTTEVQCPTLRAARQIARSWAADGVGDDPQDKHTPTWVDVAINRVRADGSWRHVEDVLSTCEAEDPPCWREHAWREARTTGHGGGVIVRERCEHCGWMRVTDTYHQRQDTGELVGHAVWYEQADDEDEE